MTSVQRRSLRLLALSLVLSAVTASQFARADDSAQDLTQWAGIYTYAGGRAERDALERAIERATAEMGPLARHIARSRLEDEMRPDQRLTVAVAGSSIGIGERGGWRTPIDGSPREFESDGDRFRVRHRFVNGRIVQTTETEDLVIRKTYSLDPQTGRLRVQVDFDHDSLPANLRYGLSYRRAQ
jgi:hypothetical protein